MYRISKIWNIPYEMWITEIDCDKEDCIDFSNHSGVIEVRAESRHLVELRAEKIIKALNENSKNIVSQAKN